MEVTRELLGDALEGMTIVVKDAQSGAVVLDAATGTVRHPQVAAVVILNRLGVDRFEAHVCGPTPVTRARLAGAVETVRIGALNENRDIDKLSSSTIAGRLLDALLTGSQPVADLDAEFERSPVASDPEMCAMAAIIAAMDSLDEATFKRVRHWYAGRFGLWAKDPVLVSAERITEAVDAAAGKVAAAIENTEFYGDTDAAESIAENLAKLQGDTADIRAALTRS
jgi:hypothetical protein